jgi:oligopeptide transport system substrate-binding protein
MKTSKFVRVLSLTLLIAMLVLTIGAVGAQDGMKVLTTGIRMTGGDIATLDPSLAEVSSSIEIMTQMYIGLVEQDEQTADPIPGLAESWTLDEATGVYTFNLIQDVPWVQYNAESGAVEEVLDDDGNVRYVTAADVAYGWERSLAPETASPYAYIILPYVAGLGDYNSGDAAFDTVGVNVVDDYTLEITATDPTSFAPSIFGMWMAWPLPQWAVEAGGDSWTEPEYYNSFGPFALKEWSHDESITIVKNPFWPGIAGIPQATLDEVVFLFLDKPVQFNEYLADGLDVADAPLEELDRINADPVLSEEYSNGTDPCTYYIAFDNTEYPMDNATLRRAFSLAIDRQSIVDNVTRGGQIPAQWFSRPGLAAAPTLESHPDLGISYDPELAVKTLNMALEELGMASIADLPPLTLSYGDSSNHGLIMQAIQQMWVDTLGIQVTLAALDPTTYFANVSEDAPIIYRAGWCQDYSDASNFLFDVFYSESSQNDAGFVNAEYDELVSAARTLEDTEERRELYAQAEEIFVDQEAGIAPVYWYTTNQLTKPWVIRTQAATGQQRYANWDISQ